MVHSYPNSPRLLAYGGLYMAVLGPAQGLRTPLLVIIISFLVSLISFYKKDFIHLLERERECTQEWGEGQR